MDQQPSGGDHVSEADAFTLQLERDPALRATIVAVATFDQAPDWEQLVERVERATRLAPTFRERLVATPLRLAPPRWVPDPDFDLSWHLRRQRLPEGGTFADVLEVARAAAMDAFDHDRPLWEFVLVEGLPDDGAALVLKVHHALTDGIGGVQIAAHVIDLERHPATAPPAAPEPAVGRRPSALGDVLEALGYDLRRASGTGVDLLRAAPGAAVRAVRDPVGTATAAIAEVRSVGRMVRPVTDTRSPVMRDRRLQRRLVHLDVPLGDLRRAAATVDGTLNVGFLGGIAAGMRRYHARHGSEVDDLRVTMPISLREEDDAIGGNHITLVRFDLPAGETDTTVLLRRIHEVCRAQRAERALGHAEAIAGVLNLLPVAVTGGMLRHVDLLASNVPGFELDAYVAGARLESFHAFGATLGSAANVTLMSYRGTCHIGVNVDLGAIPDPDQLREDLEAGFAEVLALAP